MFNKAKAYSENELLDKLKYYCPDFSVHLQDIRNPTPEFVREMYRRILIEFNIDISSLEQPHFSQMENLSPFAEMYHDSIPVINLMKAIRKLKIIDLGISDLTDPAPKRNLEQMSTIMRFVEFCDEKITEWNDKLNFVKNKRSRKKELLKNIDQLKEERNKYTLSKENSIEEKLELEKVYQILTQEQATVLNEKDTILEKRNLLKASINEKEHQVEKLNQQLCEEEELIKNTREQIVASPISIVNDLKNMRMKQLDYSEELQNLKDKLVSKKTNQCSNV
uniref:Kinetochore protein Nuf2 N-terminal domain-containing protein n=1 Tax=Clastoptera arizonana TaxID=38151 RepID=A0A1B6D0Z6_9HEMI